MNEDLLDDLDAYASDLPEPVDLPAMDDEYANRMLRRVRRVERRRREVIDVAQAERSRIDEWLAGQLDTLDRDTAHVAQLLEGYMRQVYERRQLKTLKLPNGELKLRAPKASVVITDADAFLEWALARAAREAGADVDDVKAALEYLGNEPMLRVKVEPAKGEIGKATKEGPERSVFEDLKFLAAMLEDEGEVVPGVAFERPTQDTFSYKTASHLAAVPSHDVPEQDLTQGGTDEPSNDD